MPCTRMVFMRIGTGLTVGSPPRESANDANRSVHANGSQRARHSAASTDLNHVVYALAIRQSDALLLPI